MTDHSERRLAAIMFTDMVGYSALVETDEERALALLDEHNALVEAQVGDHRGVVVKTAGDAFFVEFRSTLDACRCALAIQTAVAERNQTVAAAAQFQMRIGIHLGDVVVQDGDLFGDGVNIAARIEPLADPGGIAVSEDVARQVDGKLNQVFQDLGPHALKNLRSQVRIYRIVMPWDAHRPRHAGLVRPHATPALAAHWLVRIVPLLLAALGPLGWSHREQFGPVLQMLDPRGPRGVDPHMEPRLVYASNQSGRYRLYLWGGRSRRSTPLTTGGDDGRPAWGPRRPVVAFQRTTGRERADIWLVELRRPGEHRLTDGVGYNGEPCWSPDGDVVFVSDRAGSRRLFRLTESGGQPEPLAELGGPVESPACETHTGHFACVLTRAGRRRVYLGEFGRWSELQPLELSLPPGPVLLRWREPDAQLVVSSAGGVRVVADDGTASPDPTVPRDHVLDAVWSFHGWLADEQPAGHGHTVLRVEQAHTGTHGPIVVASGRSVNREAAWAPSPPPGPPPDGSAGGWTRAE